MIYDSNVVICEEAIFDKSHKNPVYIVLMHSGTALANIIKKVTGDEFSHACISFNSKLDPLYSFGTKGKGESGVGFAVNDPKDNFFKTHDARYDVYVMYVTDKALQAMKDTLSYFESNKNKLKYDFVGLFNIWFGKDSENHEKWFCSRFVMELISKAHQLPKVPSLWKPSDIADLDNISLVNRGFNLYNYDHKVTDRHCADIKKGKYNGSSVLFENSYTDYITGKSVEEAENIYMSRYSLFRPSFDIPRWIDTNKLEQLAFDKSNSIYKFSVKDSNKDYPFKFFNILDISQTELTNLVRTPTSRGLSTLSVKVYQYNFEKNKKRISMLLITVKNDIISAYIIGNDKLYKLEIPKSINEDIVLNSNEIIEESNVDKYAYHISDKDLNRKTLYPRIPSYLKDPKKVKENEKLGLYEDSKIPRVCVSFSIDNSLKAIIPDITEHPERQNECVGREFNVYRTEKSFYKYKHMTNSEIIKNNYVFDASLTKENWILEPVKLVYVGRIKVLSLKSTKMKRISDTMTMRDQKFNWKWIDKQSINEAISSKVINDYESKQDMSISQFSKMNLNDAVIQIYKSQYSSLSHIRINKDTKGYIWLDDKKVVAIINVEEKDDDNKWIQAFEIFGDYKGHGLSKQILRLSIKDLGVTHLSVNKDNEVAIKLYKAMGFKIYKKTDSMYFMSVNKSDYEDIEESASEVLDKTVSILKDNGFDPNVDAKSKAKFLAGEETDFGKSLCIANLGSKNLSSICSLINKEIKLIGGKVKPDNYGTIFLSVTESEVYDPIANKYIQDPHTSEDYEMTAKMAQHKLQQLQKERKLLFCQVKDIYYNGAYVFAEYSLDNKNEKELSEFVKFINKIIETSIYCGCADVSSGLLSIKETSVYDMGENTKFYKNPAQQLKRKNTIKKNDQIKKGNYIIDPSPIQTPPKSNDNEPVEEQSMEKELEKAAKDAHSLLCKEIFACRDCAYVYEDVMMPYAKDNSYAIIKWNLSKLKSSDKKQFPQCKSAVFSYCQNKFNDTHKGYVLDMDDNCFYITKK